MFKTSIPDFIDNKDKAKEEEIRKKEAQLRENKICLNNGMQNHATIILEITLLLENDKRTRLYLPMIQILILFIVKKVI